MEERRPAKSAKGYYYDLNASPYVWISPYGDSYKLPSQKRLEMMEKQVPDALHRLEKLLIAYNLRDVIPDDLARLLSKYVIEAVHASIVKR